MASPSQFDCGRITVSLQAGDTSAYAESIAGTLEAWAPALREGLLLGADDAAFGHVCSKLPALLVPYLLHNGIFRCASGAACLAWQRSCDAPATFCLTCLHKRVLPLCMQRYIRP